MSIEKITEEEVRARWVQRLPDVPNRGGRYGTPGMSAAEVKAAHDALALLIVERYNALADLVNGGTLSEEIDGAQDGETLADFLDDIRTGRLSTYLSADGERSLAELAAAFDMHTHAGVYSPVSHGHDGTYAPLVDGIVPKANLPIPLSGSGSDTTLPMSQKAATDALNGKLDRLPASSENYLLYARLLDGNDGTVRFLVAPTKSTVPFRGSGGVVRVGTPVENDDATTKQYVDGEITEAKEYADAGLAKKTDTLEFARLERKVDNLRGVTFTTTVNNKSTVEKTIPSGTAPYVQIKKVGGACTSRRSNLFNPGDTDRTVTQDGYTLTYSHTTQRWKINGSGETDVTLYVSDPDRPLFTVKRGFPYNISPYLFSSLPEGNTLSIHPLGIPENDYVPAAGERNCLGGYEYTDSDVMNSELEASGLFVRLSGTFTNFEFGIFVGHLFIEPYPFALYDGTDYDGRLVSHPVTGYETYDAQGNLVDHVDFPSSVLNLPDWGLGVKRVTALGNNDNYYSTQAGQGILCNYIDLETMQYHRFIVKENFNPYLSIRAWERNELGYVYSISVQLPAESGKGWRDGYNEFGVTQAALSTPGKGAVRLSAQNDGIGTLYRDYGGKKYWLPINTSNPWEIGANNVSAFGSFLDTVFGSGSNKIPLDAIWKAKTWEEVTPLTGLDGMDMPRIPAGGKIKFLTDGDEVFSEIEYDVKTGG